MRKFVRFFLLSGAAAIVFLFAVTFSYGATNLGKATYDQYCASCHGSNGQGSSGPAIAGKTAADVQQKVRTGATGMPAFNSSQISDAALQDLSLYVQSGLGSGSDTTPPTVSNVKPSGTISTNSATLSAYVSDTGGSGINTASEAVYLDGSAVSGCSRSSTYVSCNVTGLAPGSHTVLVSVKDNAAWQTTGSSSFTSPDVTAPSVTNITPSGWTTSTSATIRAYFADSGSGVNSASARVYLDGSARSGCTATASGVSCPVSGLSQGAHTISVTVADNAGNTGNASGSFNVDSVAPSVSNIQPSGTIASSSATISAYYSDTGSGVNSASARVYLDGNPVSGCTATASGVSCPVSSLSTGSHSIYVSVSDNAGNVGTGNVSFTVSDNTAPVIGGITPAGGSWINTSSASIVVYYSDDISGVNTGSNTRIQLDGSTMSGCVKTQTSISCPASGLGDGSHSLSIRVTDNAGNQANTTSTFSVDTAKPTISGLQPSGTITTAATTVYANYSDSGSGVNSASTRVYLDSNPVSGCTATASSVSCPVSSLSQGTHTISVTVADNAGNTGNASGSFNVDSVAPSVSNIQPSGTIASSSATISAYYSDTGSGVNSASARVYLDGNPVSGCTATASGVSCPVSGLADGSHTISVNVGDMAGNSSSGSGSFVVSTTPSDTTPPAVSNIQPAGTINTGSATINAYYSDTGSGVNSASARVYLDSNPVSGCTATASQVSCSVSSLSTGSHSINVSVSDNAGNVGTGNVSFTVSDNTAPVIGGITPADGSWTNASSATVMVYYSDDLSGINTGSSTYTRVRLDGNTLSSCTKTQTSMSCPASGLGDGSHSLSIRVTDNAGNQTNATTSFSVDTAGPVISGLSPSGTINTAATSVYASLSDTGSGVNSASARVYLDGNPVSGCTATASSVSCPVSGLTDGSHSFTVSAADNLGNQQTASGFFTVSTASPDTTPPSVSNIQPSGTIASSSATISAYYSDTGSGVNSASARVYLDSNPVSGCTPTASGVSCPVSGLSQGTHTISVTVADNAGNIGSGNGGFAVNTSPGGDTTPPNITYISPTGSIRSHSAIIAVYYNDGSGSGVNSSSVTVALDGNPLSSCTVTTSGANCSANGISKGRHEISVSIADNSGNTSSTTSSFTTASNYYWTWYDGQNAANWILMGNSLSGPSLMDFKLSIENQDMDLAAFAVYGHAPGEVPRGRSITPIYPGVMNGPVEASSLTGDSAIVSQRSIWHGYDGGKSIEEVPGIDENRLSSHYYWTWYDMLTGDYKDWILVANPNSTEIWYRIKIAGQVVWTGSLAPAGQAGDRETPTFPGVMGGPVEVEAAADQYFNTPSNAIASQRVLMHGGNAFNELPGIPAEELSDRYLWTWYDMQTPGSSDWMLVANPSDTDQVDYQIEIGSKGCDPNPANRPAGTACQSGTLDPGGQVTPTFAGIMTGPVEVKAVLHGTNTPAKVIASQRILWGPSFEETPGLPAGSLYNGMTSDYHWTWYDQASAGAINWVLVANPGSTPVNYSIKIAGHEMQRGTLQTAGQPGDRVTPTFPGVMNGPVEVTAWTGDVNNEAGGTPTDVVASQRYLWSGYFNEVLGTILN